MIKRIPQFKHMVFIIFAIILCVSVCSAEESEKHRDFFDLGMDSLQNGELEKSITFFNRAIEDQPQHYYAHLKRGVAYRYLMEHEKAIANFNKCIELDPDRPEAYFELSYLSSYRGDFQEAIRYNLKSIELEPKFSKAYGTLAIMKSIAGDHRDAIEILTNGISINPMEPMLYIVRGQIFDVLGQCEEAIKDFEKGMSFDPEEFNTDANIAWILSTCPDGKFRDGQKALNILKSKKDAEESALLLNSLAAAHAEQGNFEKAVALQKKSILKEKSREPDGELESLYYKQELKKSHQQLESYKKNMPWRTQVPET